MAAFYQKGHGRILQLGGAAGFCFSWPTSPAGTPTATAVAEFKSWLHQFRKPHDRLKEHDEQRGAGEQAPNTSKILSSTGRVSLISPCAPLVSGDKNRKV